MHETAAASLWNTESASLLARRIAAIPGLYCGPAAIAWIAAVWNAHQGVPYAFNERLKNKALFADGPRTFAHSLPVFQTDLNHALFRETYGHLQLSQERYYRYETIHRLMRDTDMPFVVRIPTASLRDGLHYVTLFRTVMTDTTFRCYWQDNGVFKSDELMHEGISVSIRSANKYPFFFWGARKVVKV